MSDAGSGLSPAPRLLFDQNLSSKLVRRLADLYPGSAHVRDFELSSAGDEAVPEASLLLLTRHIA